MNNDIIIYNKSTDERVKYNNNSNVKNEIRRNLKSIDYQNASKKILFSELKTNDLTFFDVENILIYNIGTSYFKNLARDGLVFYHNESSIDDRNYNYTYKLVSKADTDCLFERNRLINFDISLDKLTTKTHPLEFMKKTKIHPEDNYNSESISKIGIDLVLKFKKENNKNLTSYIKKIIDGITLSLHCFGDISEDLLRSMRNKYNDICREDFKFEKYKIFGCKENLIFLYRNSIKVNPDDNKVKLFRITRKIDNKINSEVKIKGSIYKL
ncbi:hypothetical protein C7380_10328 [Oceanotoga teriensis]|uniref:Uncharacterized protein n=1 Tax=Oceanotoga teriensis TaxID=515440 RepID=A0AA45C805_9BACT|nr:hypothetical protein [Oceanotoga teriensis]PWJ95851.1 hypothetical protein C7380_10328 [Oceanotoga teriensis]